MGAAELGSWGGGGGTGKISTGGLGACGGPSRVGVVEEFWGGLAVLAAAETVIRLERRERKERWGKSRAGSAGRIQSSYLSPSQAQTLDPERTRHTLVRLVSPTHRDPAGKAPLPGKAVGGAGVGTAMGTPTLPLPLFSRLLLRLLLGWLPPLLPLLTASRSANRWEEQTHWDDHKTRLIQQEENHTNNTAVFHQSCGAAGINVR